MTSYRYHDGYSPTYQAQENSQPQITVQNDMYYPETIDDARIDLSPHPNSRPLGYDYNDPPNEPYANLPPLKPPRRSDYSLNGTTDRSPTDHYATNNSGTLRSNRSGPHYDEAANYWAGSPRGNGRAVPSKNGTIPHETRNGDRGSGRGEDMGGLGTGIWRNPELSDVIEFLRSGKDVIRLNAAAYLQHLCFRSPEKKERIRELNGIPPLIDLIYSDNVNVHKNGLGALLNLSYGANMDIKREIATHGGVPALVSLLQRSPDPDIREVVAAVLWNLSSCQEVKRSLINQALRPLVAQVIVPHAGLEKRGATYVSLNREVYWSTLFRNASGVIRNISSDGRDGRIKLRDCDGLVESLLHIVRSAIGNNDIDNKSVENCVCTLRNLCYACQEVADPGYLLRRDTSMKEGMDTKKRKDSQTCCAGSACCTNKKPGEAGPKSVVLAAPGPPNGVPTGRSLLWQPNVSEIYLPLLCDCSNPETLEAAAGAIQNLAACDWQPSVDFRQQIRREKGLTILAELLNIGADRVVCAAARALRNLALDKLSCELIGQYAMEQLVARLPRVPIKSGTLGVVEPADQGQVSSLETIAAVLATLYTLIKENENFATQFLHLSGVHRCIHLARSGLFLDPDVQPPDQDKVPRFAEQVLRAMWEVKKLRERYTQLGWSEADFYVTKRGLFNKGTGSKNRQSIGRPAMNKSGVSTRMDTVPRERMIKRHTQQQVANSNSVDRTERDHPHQPPDPGYSIPNRGVPSSYSAGDYGYHTTSSMHPSSSGDGFLVGPDTERQRLQAGSGSLGRLVSPHTYDNPGHEANGGRRPAHEPTAYAQLASPQPMQANGGREIRPDELPLSHMALTEYPYATIEFPANNHNPQRPIDPNIEPLYARVDREKKLSTRRNLYLDSQPDPSNVDSWV